jgi:hypothetical protein
MTVAPAFSVARATLFAALAIGLGVPLAPRPAWGFSSGVSGLSRSGCGGCHTAGGTTPPAALRLAGPLVVTAGSAARFTLSGDGLAMGAGFDLAASAGSLAVVDGSLSQLKDGELTHTPDWPRGSRLALEFDLTAPVSPGKVTLSFTVLSVNGDTGTDGDAGASASVDVEVQAPADLAGADLLGIDLAVVDLATAAADLAGADLASRRGKVYVDEKRAFGCAIAGGGTGRAGDTAVPVPLLLCVALALPCLRRPAVNRWRGR